MRRLVLLGGGHAHVFVLDALARQPIPDAEVLLIAPYRRQVYSGMLPGWIAGHYPLEACMIPLDRLAERCGCRFLRTFGCDIDTEARNVVCADGSRIAYDLLSIDVGSTTAVAALEGAAEHALPVRPIEMFIAGWEQILKAAPELGETNLAVIGGGAAGVELALSMEYRFRRDIGERSPRIQLISATRSLLPDHPNGVGRRVERLLRERRVGLHLGLKAVSADSSGVRLSNGELIEAFRIILATGPVAPAWLWQTGISLDRGGFIEVNENLRSVSHPDIFAAGDTASLVGHPRPKSGVYAVRAGPPLAENLRRVLEGEPPVRHVPQKRALYLLSSGDRYAVASWGPFGWAGDWVWNWKDRIDRSFVARYSRAGNDPASAA